MIAEHAEPNRSGVRHSALYFPSLWLPPPLSVLQPAFIPTTCSRESCDTLCIVNADLRRVRIHANFERP